MDDPIVELPPDTEVTPNSYVEQSVPTWHLPRAQWDKIRKIATGKGTKIAHLDTGRFDHELLPRPLVSKSYIPGEDDRDVNGHSTHCRGTSLARDPNIGVAPDAESLVYKVLSNRGSGASSGIAAAVRQAVDDGADVLSLSLGGPSRYEPTVNNIRYAISQGVWVCLAAGNSGFNGNTNSMGYPARAGQGIAVAALAENYRPARFSSGGAQMMVAAPGQNILSTRTGGGLVMMSGTSMATPFVAGVVSLITEVGRRLGKPSMTSQEAVRRFFELNCKDLLTPGHDPATGFGMLDVLDLLPLLLTDNLKFV